MVCCSFFKETLKKDFLALRKGQIENNSSEKMSIGYFVVIDKGKLTIDCLDLPHKVIQDSKN